MAAPPGSTSISSTLPRSAVELVEPLAELAPLLSERVGPDHHDVRIARIDLARPGTDDRRGLLGAELGLAHLHGHLGGPWPVAGNVLDGLRAGERPYRERRRVDEARLDRHFSQAPHPVAAHLGHATIGVHQVHGQVGPVATGQDADHAVCSDPEGPVAQGPHQRGVEGLAVLDVDEDDEVVAGAVELGAVQLGAAPPGRPRSFVRCRHDAVDQSPAVGAVVPSSRKSATMPTGSSSGSTHTIRGSRRNHAIWRRAKALVLRTAPATASSSGAPSSTWASSSR